jgi:uncharacterized membrane protein
MNTVLSACYTIVLALWIGGMTLFTFVLTPVIFRSYGRDMAGEIVGRLFPGYFLYTLVLSIVGLVLISLLTPGRTAPAFRLSLCCAIMAVVISLFIVFKLHPDTVRVKQQVVSFERESPDSPARKEFRKLHGVSAVLNLLVLADGVVLLLVGQLTRK